MKPIENQLVRDADAIERVRELCKSDIVRDVPLGGPMRANGIAFMANEVLKAIEGKKANS